MIVTLVLSGIIIRRISFPDYMLKVNNKDKRHIGVVVLVSLLLTLNIFHFLFWCFYCKLWEGKWRLGYYNLEWFCSQSLGAISYQVYGSLRIYQGRSLIQLLVQELYTNKKYIPLQVLRNTQLLKTYHNAYTTRNYLRNRFYQSFQELVLT